MTPSKKRKSINVTKGTWARAGSAIAYHVKKAKGNDESRRASVTLVKPKQLLPRPRQEAPPSEEVPLCVNCRSNIENHEELDRMQEQWKPFQIDFPNSKKPN